MKVLKGVYFAASIIELWKAKRIFPVYNCFFSLAIQPVFEGIRGRGKRGDIAIDDTIVKNGPCPPPGSCDFEKGLCAYQNELVDDDFDWERNTGHTGSIGTGPSSDHTTGSAAGKKVLLLLRGHTPFKGGPAFSYHFFIKIKQHK